MLDSNLAGTNDHEIHWRPIESLRYSSLSTTSSVYTRIK